MKNQLGFIVILLIVTGASAQWQSDIVYYGVNNRLVYVRDSLGNQIPDFSYAGYRNSDYPIPDIDTVLSIDPVEGDNTSHIQAAIDSVGSLAPDENGFRGALYLKPGTYEIRGTIKINYDGVVLRGAGDQDDPAGNTILSATGNSPTKRTVLVAGGGDDSKWRDMVSGSKTDILTDTILVNERSFRVLNSSLYHVGDNVILFHPCTDEWLQSIDYGGTHSDGSGAEAGVDVPWVTGSQPLVYNRYITEIRGDTVTIDAPVYNILIRTLSQSYLYTYNRYRIKTHIGIENLRIDIRTAGGTDENHAWNAIDLYEIEDAWVRNCTMLHFGLSGVRTNTADRITVENCQALDPVGQVVGGNFYNFNAYTASQQILFKDCYARNGRHHYVSNGTSYNSGVVFLNCTSSGAYTSSEGHRRWSQGFLYDNHVELDGPRAGVNPRLLGLYNRGYYGTSHGWALTNSVAWNCDVNQGDLIVQKPPVGQNYAIGCSGKNITGQSPPSPFDEPEGYIESANQSGLEPASLFLAQLQDRHKIVDRIPEPSGAESVPDNFTLEQNFPNPFNPATHIRYYLSFAGQVRLQIFDMLGRKVSTLVDGYQPAGQQELVWQGVNDRNMRVNSGVYILQLNVDGVSLQRKMLLMR